MRTNLLCSRRAPCRPGPERARAGPSVLSAAQPLAVLFRGGRGCLRTAGSCPLLCPPGSQRDLVWGRPPGLQGTECVPAGWLRERAGCPWSQAAGFKALAGGRRPRPGEACTCRGSSFECWAGAERPGQFPSLLRSLGGLFRREWRRRLVFPPHRDRPLWRAAGLWEGAGGRRAPRVPGGGAAHRPGQPRLGAGRGAAGVPGRWGTGPAAPPRTRTLPCGSGDSQSLFL